MQKTTILMKKYLTWFPGDDALQALLPLFT